jgi:hypothetical protein
MSRTYHNGERRIRVRGVRKDPPDLRRLARALIEFAQAEQEAAAEADHEVEQGAKTRQQSALIRTTETNTTTNGNKNVNAPITPDTPRKGAA